MPATTAMGDRPLKRRNHAGLRQGGMRGAEVGETGDRRTRGHPALPHRVSQGDQIVLVRTGG